MLIELRSSLDIFQIELSSLLALFMLQLIDEKTIEQLLLRLRVRIEKMCKVNNIEIEEA